MFAGCQYRLDSSSVAFRYWWRVRRGFDDEGMACAPHLGDDATQASWGWVTSFDAKRTYNVPDQTAQVARASFPKGNPVMRLHDDLHMVVEDRDFADLFPTRGRPAEAVFRMARPTTLRENRSNTTAR